MFLKSPGKHQSDFLMKLKCPVSDIKAGPGIILALSVYFAAILELIGLLKSKEYRFWFLIFSVQILIACAIPTGIFLMLPADNETVSLEVSGCLLEDLTPDEAEQTLKSYYKNIIDNGAVFLSAGGKKIAIPLNLFEFQIDASKIYNMLHEGRYNNRYFQLIGKANREFVTKPVVSINSARLKDILESYKDLFHRGAVDAKLVLEQGIARTIPESEGLELDVEKAAYYIKNMLESDPSKEIVISREETADVFNVVKPAYTADGLSGLSQIYGMVQGELESESKLKFQNIFNSMKNSGIKPGDEFSYRERVLSSIEEDSPHTIIASAIYKAVLPVADIKVTFRKPSSQPVAGIEPGFDVNLDEEGDLKFLNASDSDLMLVFDIQESGKWTVALLGEPGLMSGDIVTEVTKIAPPVIYSQDSRLPEKSQEVVEPGREGLSVKVKRVVQGESRKVYELYEDIYQPVYKIIAIGTAVKKEDIIRK